MRRVVRLALGARPTDVTRRMLSDAEVASSEPTQLAKEILCGDCFHIMGVERGYDISNYKERFRQLQKVFHPDKSIQYPEKEREMFEKVSAKCNDCFSALSDPYSKGCMLLKLETGFDINDEEHVLELSERLDQSFLDQVMDMKIAIFEAASDNDVGELTGLKAASKAKYDTTLGELSSCFAARDYDGAQDTLLCLNYYRKMLYELKEMLPPE